MLTQRASFRSPSALRCVHVVKHGAVQLCKDPRGLPAHAERARCACAPVAASSRDTEPCERGRRCLLHLLCAPIALSVAVLGVAAWPAMAAEPYSSPAVSPVFQIPGFSATPGAPADAAPRPSTPATMPDVAAAPEYQLTPEERAVVNIFEKNTPSVVNIANLASYALSPYGMDYTMLPQGTGSGFVWDDQGHVVTNYHVVKGASSLKVTLYDSTSCSAQIIGMDENKDIAVLKLDITPERAQELRAVQLGRSSGLAVGQRVYAIGNPFGLDHTLTSGVVSGLQREIQATSFGPKIKGVIQTDAAINPGNSGGVLLNSRGQLIGVNSAILDPSQRGAFSGVGFAIPVDMVKGLVEQILTYGQVIRPVLGITMGPPAMMSRLNVDGVLVYSAPKDGPAGGAGIQGCTRTQFGDLVIGDIIVGFNGKTVSSYADLFDALDECKPGDKVVVDILRPASRKKMPVTVVLGQRTLDVQDG